FVYSASHPIYQKCRSTRFAAAELGGIVRTYIPKTVFSLGSQNTFHQLLKILDMFCAVFLVVGHKIQDTYQSSDYPTVSARPITVFAIRFLVRWNKIFVSPPEFIFSVVKSTSFNIT